MPEELSEGLIRFLHDLSPEDRDHVLSVLSGCRTIVLESGVPQFTNGFSAEALLLVDSGFVILRATMSPALRSVVTCEAGPGSVLLAPAGTEVLLGLGRSRLTVVDPFARATLLRVPAVADRLVQQLALALRQNQEAIANFAPARHVDRVRGKLLELAGSSWACRAGRRPHRLPREPRVACGDDWFFEGDGDAGGCPSPARRLRRPAWLDLPAAVSPQSVLPGSGRNG